MTLWGTSGGASAIVRRGAKLQMHKLDLSRAAEQDSQNQRVPKIGQTARPLRLPPRISFLTKPLLRPRRHSEDTGIKAHGRRRGHPRDCRSASSIT